MKVSKLFETILQEMSKEEKMKKQKELEQSLEEIKGEYRSADDKDKQRIMQKMNRVKTQLNSLKIIHTGE
jgi:hypothetical protein